MADANSLVLRSKSAPSVPLLLSALVALTAIRLFGLHVSSVDLYYDEAQYWAWSRDLAFGYFSKPPLLAWVIAALQPICGSGEACVRAASPLFYLATSLTIYALADSLYGRKTALSAALLFAFLPGVVFSARVISTDVPLLFFWTLALLACVKLLRAPDWRWAGVLALSLGFGLLAKYAMIYFLLGAAVAAAFDAEARALFRRPQTWAALAAAAVMISPNIVWNLSNGLVTFRHTGENINGGGLRFQPLESVAFVVSQFAVAGPFVFTAFLALLFRARALGREDRLMLAFAIPPLALVVALSFFRGANPNWAAPALISATVAVAAWWIRTGRSRWLALSLGLGLVLQAAMLIGDAYADRISIAALGSKADIYQRTLGWRALGQEAAQIAQAQGAATVATEGRAEMAALSYYLRDKPLAVFSWQHGESARNQFDLTQALSDNAKEPILLITDCPHRERLAAFFGSVMRAGKIGVRSGPTSQRHYVAFRLEKRLRPIGPLAVCGKAGD